MRKIIPSSIILLVLVLLGSAFYACPALSADDLSAPGDYVTDRAGILNSAQREELEGLLMDFDQKTTNQLLVVTIPSLPAGESLETYSFKLAEASRAGRAGEDNGLLLLIVSEERKMRIEVGYGLEDRITDGRAGRVIRQTLAPAFQQGNYYQGINQALLSMIDWIDPSYLPEGAKNKLSSQSDEGLGSLIMLIIFLTIWAISAISARKTKRRWYGRGFTERAGPTFFPASSGRKKGPGSGFGGFRGGGGFSGGGGRFGGGGASGGW